MVVAQSDRKAVTLDRFPQSCEEVEPASGTTLSRRVDSFLAIPPCGINLVLPVVSSSSSPSFDVAEETRSAS